MSQHVRYEIEIRLPVGAVDRKSPEKELFEKLADVTVLTFRPNDVEHVGHTEGLDCFTMSGEESDWARPDERRHEEVVKAVHALHPEASVTTRWVCLDHVNWDNVYGTQEETNT